MQQLVTNPKFLSPKPIGNPFIILCDHQSLRFVDHEKLWTTFLLQKYSAYCFQFTCSNELRN